VLSSVFWETRGKTPITRESCLEILVMVDFAGVITRLCVERYAAHRHFW
jgi:hypothetical protein